MFIPDRKNLYDDVKVDAIGEQQGIIDQLDIFNLDMDDQDITGGLDRRIDDSNKYWNSPTGHNLKDTRQSNTNLWLGKHTRGNRNSSRFVDPIIDNRVFASIESIISHVTSQAATPEVSPAHDTERSRILSTDIEKVAMAWATNAYLNEKTKSAVRNLMLKRIGILKLRWDSTYGKNGEIIVESINPDHVIIDKNAAQGENPGFICHTLKASVEDLIAKFPQKKEEIFNQCNIKQGTPKQLAQIIAYREVWLTYYKDGKPKEGVVWYFRQTVLGKMENPNWLPETEGGKRRNFLDAPLKPFIPINYINDGQHWIDNTSAVELTRTLQEGLNKRNIQIAENVEHANGQRVFSSKALSAESAARLTGNPNQKIIVKAEDVRTAVTNLQGQMLPQYVFEDKYDLRNEIDNILGTPNVFRGEQSNSNTLGQDVMVRNQAFSRQDDILRAIDIAMDRLFKYLVQMFKVYYREEHYFTIAGEDGRFDFIAMSTNTIEEGIDIRVKPGSTLAFDKERAEAVALKLASMKLIDPLSLYEDLRMPNAQKRFERLVKFNVDPTLLAEDIKKEDADRDAYIDYITIMNGKEAKPRDEVTEEHLKSHREQMMTGEFRKAKPEYQQALIDHVTLETENLRKRTILEETQLPSPTDMQPPGVPGQPPQPGVGMNPPAVDPSNIMAMLAQRQQTQTASTATPPGVSKKVTTGNPAIPGQSPSVV